VAYKVVAVVDFLKCRLISFRLLSSDNGWFGWLLVNLFGKKIQGEIILERFNRSNKALNER
jgi:hypothetical protein